MYLRRVEMVFPYSFAFEYGLPVVSELFGRWEGGGVRVRCELFHTSCMALTLNRGPFSISRMQESRESGSFHNPSPSLPLEEEQQDTPPR